jgi:hypothetical protein
VQWQIFFQPGDKATIVETNANNAIIGTVRAKSSAVWWFSLLLGAFGIWALATRKIYLGGEFALSGRAAVGVGFLALAAALLRVLYHADFNLDVGAYSLALIAIVSVLLARRAPAEAGSLPDHAALPGRRLPLWAITALGVVAGCLLGVLIKDPDYWGASTPWEMLRLIVTALVVAGAVLALLAYSSPARTSASRVALVAGGLFLGFTFGYLTETILGAVWPMETTVLEALKNAFRLVSTQSG